MKVIIVKTKNISTVHHKIRYLCNNYYVKLVKVACENIIFKSGINVIYCIGRAYWFYIYPCNKVVYLNLNAVLFKST